MLLPKRALNCLRPSVFPLRVSTELTRAALFTRRRSSMARLGPCPGTRTAIRTLSATVGAQVGPLVVVVVMPGDVGDPLAGLPEPPLVGPPPVVVVEVVVVVLVGSAGSVTVGTVTVGAFSHNSPPNEGVVGRLSQGILRSGCFAAAHG
jgi:hypothetical protein